MKEPTAAGRELERPSTAPGSAHMRVAVLDTDSGFLQVLGKRLERLGWEQRVLASPVPTDTVVAMRLNAIVIDLELIELLAGAEGRVLEREEIYQRVWGYAMARGDRSVDVFVRKLRQKLEKA